ncbi:MAG: FAD:protein FMN transferase [Treponema sp.]|nr:FAD:protein FMN transferase [Treponema sp.]
MKVRLKHTLLFLLFFPSCFRSGGLPPQSEFVLDTLCTVNLFEGGTRERYAAVFARIREIDRMMSAYQDGSDTDLVNRNAGVSPAGVHPEFIGVLETALKYARLSGGAFDPSIGPLVRLWGIGTDREHVPSPKEIGEALSLVDYRDLVVDRERGTAFLARPGQALDLGAIAKGYAADEALRVIREAGVRRAIIDLGGNIMTAGSRRSGIPGFTKEEPWRIGVQDPLDERGTYLGILQVRGQSVVTSGVYERYFEQDGRRYHHILSTVNGYPAAGGLLSVTITADSSTDADALSTAAFALGWEKGSALVESIPGAGAVFVFDSRSVRCAGTIRPEGAPEDADGEGRIAFTLTNSGYRLE